MLSEALCLLGFKHWKDNHTDQWRSDPRHPRHGSRTLCLARRPHSNFFECSASKFADTVYRGGLTFLMQLLGQGALSAHPRQHFHPPQKQAPLQRVQLLALTNIIPQAYKHDGIIGSHHM